MAWIYCPYCGQRLSEDTMFCPRCGKQLKGTQTTVYSGSPKLNKQKRHGCLSIILKITVILFIFLFVVGSCSEANRSSEEAFDQYMQGVFGGDPEKLEGLFVSEIVARQQGQNDFDIRDSIHVEDIPTQLAEQYGYDYKITYQLLSEQEVRGDDALQGIHILLQLSGNDTHFDAVRYLYYELEIEGSEGSDIKRDVLIAAEIDGAWYILA